jgi:hypothetical protein
VLLKLSRLLIAVVRDTWLDLHELLIWCLIIDITLSPQRQGKAGSDRYAVHIKIALARFSTRLEDRSPRVCSSWVRLQLSSIEPALTR